MKIYNFPQHNEDGSPNEDWLALRAGKFTGSDFFLFMSLIKKGELSDTAESKLYEKVLADFGELTESVSTPAMERGIELEPIARAEYMSETFNDVQEVGFVDYESLHAGCSPDGIITTDGLPVKEDGGNIAKIIEIKSPLLKNYIKMARGKIPAQYLVQVQYNLFITGAKSCDFVIYHPSMRLIIKNIKPDEQIQKDIHVVLEKLNTLYDAIMSDLETMKK